MRKNVVNKAWMTDTLRNAGCLPSGAVTRITEEVIETSPSILRKLKIGYTADAPKNAPRQLIWKAPKPHKAARFLREVRFYQEVKTRLAGVGLVACFGLSDGPDAIGPWLLLEDVSTSHYLVGATPDYPELSQIVTGLARLHAVLWNHTDLEKVAGMGAVEVFHEDFKGNERRFLEMRDIFGDRLPHSWVRIYEWALREAPDRLIARTQRGPLTLCHPDAHTGNFLLPKAPADPVLIIDWHDYRAWWGVGDVARLLLLDSELRRRLERGLLMRYYEALCAAVVTDYRWEDLLIDYRLSVLNNLFLPLGNRRQPWAWEQLCRAMSAWEDAETDHWLAAG